MVLFISFNVFDCCIILFEELFVFFSAVFDIESLEVFSSCELFMGEFSTFVNPLFREFSSNTLLGCLID